MVVPLILNLIAGCHFCSFCINYRCFLYGETSYIPSSRSHACHSLFRLPGTASWPQCNFQLQRSRLLCLLLIHSSAMDTCNMRLEINFRTKCPRKFFRGTFALFTQKVILSKVLCQSRVVPIEFITAVGITKVAVIMFTS